MKGYQEAAGHRRCELEIESTPPHSDVFTVFIRQNSTFIENFSIGLRYHTGDPHARNGHACSIQRPSW